MTTVDEGRLTLVFDDEVWKAVKYDVPNGFADGIKIPATKKVDILAVSTHTLMMIEVKDFRGREAGHPERFAKGGSDLIEVEIAQKVRDTVAVLLAAFRCHDSTLKPMSDHLFDRGRKSVEIVFFLERDNNVQRKVTRYRSTKTIGDAVGKLLRPFKVGCSVQNLAGGASRRGDGWSVANRPDAAS